MLKGKCLGVAEQTRGKGDNKFKVTVLGISETKNDLFGSEQITEVQLSKQQTQNGIIKTLNDQKGKDITVEIWQKHNASGARVFTNTHLIGIVS